MQQNNFYDTKIGVWPNNVLDRMIFFELKTTYANQSLSNQSINLNVKWTHVAAYANDACELISNRYDTQFDENWADVVWPNNRMTFINDIFVQKTRSCNGLKWPNNVLNRVESFELKATYANQSLLDAEAFLIKKLLNSMYWPRTAGNGSTTQRMDATGWTRGRPSRAGITSPTSMSLGTHERRRPMRNGYDTRVDEVW